MFHHRRRIPRFMACSGMRRVSAYVELGKDYIATLNDLFVTLLASPVDMHIRKQTSYPLEYYQPVSECLPIQGLQSEKKERHEIWVGMLAKKPNRGCCRCMLRTCCVKQICVVSHDGGCGTLSLVLARCWGRERRWNIPNRATRRRRWYPLAVAVTSGSANSAPMGLKMVANTCRASVMPRTAPFHRNASRCPSSQCPPPPRDISGSQV
ncbi:hypothetical protein QBC41DRAFT_329554, partial [Cercophora samala]